MKSSPIKSSPGCRWLAWMIEAMPTVALVITIFGGASAAEWPQFRGPGGAGAGASAVPLTWSDTTNLKWKTALPGPGSSSPIVQGDRVFVTCYSGGAAAGQVKLTRHLVCIRKADGRVEWQRDLPAELPEDAYEGFLTEHGYASCTATMSSSTQPRRASRSVPSTGKPAARPGRPRGRRWNWPTARPDS